MNAPQAARHVAALCLAENRSLADELRGWAPAAANTAAAGDLARALRQLGVDARSAELATVRPAALQRADALIATLPTPAAIRVPLIQTCLWFAFIALIQLAVLGVLSTKVYPVLRTMLRDHQLAGVTSWSDDAWPLLAFSGVVLATAAALAWFGPAFLPGWGRTLARAHEAARAAALAESDPPPGAWAQWLSSARGLPAGGAGADFRALAQEWGRGAERQMQRFVTGFRFAGFALLTLVALATTIDVYTTCAALAGIR